MQQLNLWAKKQGLLELNSVGGGGWGGGCSQSKVLGQVDFLAGQVPLIYSSLAQGFQVSHPLIKSLTKMSQKWPWESKMKELLAQRTSWISCFLASPVGCVPCSRPRILSGLKK